MNEPRTFTRTASAEPSACRPTTPMDRVHQALLSTIDGHRNVIELESVARAMGLQPGVLERLRTQGLIEIANDR